MARMDDVVSELRAITMGATHSAREKRRLSQAIRRQIRLDQLHSKNLSVVVYCRESCIKVHINVRIICMRVCVKVYAYVYMFVIEGDTRGDV